MGARTALTLPFDSAQFVEVFRSYNLGVWPLQWVLPGLALAAIVLARRGTAPASRGASAILALLWAWMAAAYHLAYFTAINPAAPFFAAAFALAAALFGWFGVVRGSLRFGPRARRSWLGWTLILTALALYPALGYASGLRYPGFPTFGLPCPTTIFTLGLLHFTVEQRRPVLAVPLAWCAVGASAAVSLGIWPDLLLPAAGIASLPLLFRATPRVISFVTDGRFVRRRRELRTIETMARMYCRRHHRGKDLCPDCKALHDYARRRLERCVFGDAKPTCANCTVHCYKAEMREKVRTMMRWAGPRMLIRHPVTAVLHLVDGRRPAPRLPERSKG